MKVLTKGIYYHKSKATKKTSLWHDCDNYKGRGESRRVPMSLDTETKDEAIYTCPYCDFVYTLDKHLVLQESNMD